MVEPHLEREIEDVERRLHTMVAADNLYWSDCLEHNNLLGEALAGLPGAKLPCLTGRGWPEGRLIRVGWPVWLASTQPYEVAANPNTPASALICMLEITNFTHIDRVISHPNMTPELFDLVARKCPDEQAAVEAFRHPQMISFTDEKTDFSVYHPDFLGFALSKEDLSQVPKVVLKHLLELGNDLISIHLATNNTTPAWVLEKFIQSKGMGITLAGNENATAEILDQVVDLSLAVNSYRSMSEETLRLAAMNPNISPLSLAKISLSEGAEVSRLASWRLAKLTFPRKAPEVELAGATEPDVVGLAL